MMHKPATVHAAPCLALTLAVSLNTILWKAVDVQREPT